MKYVLSFIFIVIDKYSDIKWYCSVIVDYEKYSFIFFFLYIWWLILVFIVIKLNFKNF